MRNIWRLLGIDNKDRVGDAPARPWSALALAVLGWWAILASFAVQLYSIGQSDLRIATMALIGDTEIPVLTRDIVAFLLAQLLIHTTVGVACWLLALASRRAYPTWRVTLVQWTILWLVLSYLAIDAANTAAFPRSNFSGTLDTTQLVATVTVGDVLLTLIGLMIATTVARAAWFIGRALWALEGVRKRARPIAACALTAMAGMLWVRMLDADPQANVSRERPHIIVIGLDSLRPDMVADERGVSLTPNVQEFLKTATTFDDAITPLARTFPSWVTILSGKNPVRSGARDNLMPANMFDASPTLAERLRAAGYATTYATDEVRYSNIDESFGFDRIVSPEIGAADFLVPRWADLPASNLLVNTRVGQWLLPNLYGNRAAATLYRPDTFLDWVDRSVDFDRPTFLAVHLTLAHMPYFWSESDQLFGARERSDQYFNSVIGVDRQFGKLMQLLQQRGALRQAIVVVLSDHGEALGLPDDSIIDGPEAKAAVGPQLIPNSGHGNGVLSTTQFQILLAFRRFDSAVVAAPPAEPLRCGAPATLEDITPTVLDLAHVPAAAADFDGVSLAAHLAAPRADTAPDPRMRFTESGLTTMAMRVGNYTETDNIREAVRFYKLDAQTGRVQFNGDRLNDLFAQKERAVVSGEWLLAAVPTKAPKVHKFILIRRSGGVPAVVTTDPDVQSNPVFVGMWRAMKGRWGDELAGTTTAVSAAVTRSPAS
jgi:arylsulfatase A-like enzyme